MRRHAAIDFVFARFAAASLRMRTMLIFERRHARATRTIIAVAKDTPALLYAALRHTRSWRISFCRYLLMPCSTPRAPTMPLPRRPLLQRYHHAADCLLLRHARFRLRHAF